MRGTAQRTASSGTTKNRDVDRMDGLSLISRIENSHYIRSYFDAHGDLMEGRKA